MACSMLRNLTYAARLSRPLGATGTPKGRFPWGNFPNSTRLGNTARVRLSNLALDETAVPLYNKAWRIKGIERGLSN
jgi:hypothetical protein